MTTEQEAGKCFWDTDAENEYGLYSTSCKNDFMFNDGGVHENKFVYCPYCGGKIEESK